MSDRGGCGKIRNNNYLTGREVVYTSQFRKARDAHLADIMVATNRMVIRLEKVSE